MRNLRARVKELTPRNSGQSLRKAIEEVNKFTRGWYAFFGICTRGIDRVVGNTDAHIRRRLRAMILKHWKTKRTTARRLIRLGVKRKTAWERVYAGRKGLWALSHDSAVHGGLRNVYFTDRGLESLRARFRIAWEATDAPRQQQLFADLLRS